MSSSLSHTTAVGGQGRIRHSAASLSDSANARHCLCFPISSCSAVSNPLLTRSKAYLSHSTSQQIPICIFRIPPVSAVQRMSHHCRQSTKSYVHLLNYSHEEYIYASRDTTLTILRIKSIFVQIVIVVFKFSLRCLKAYEPDIGSKSTKLSLNLLVRTKFSNRASSSSRQHAEFDQIKSLRCHSEVHPESWWCQIEFEHTESLWYCREAQASVPLS